MSSVEFKGYAVTDANAWSTFNVINFEPKKFEETDVELTITHCGVCGSDLHTVTSGWGALQTPMIPGHEIVGTVTRVGSQVKGFKIGDRAGIGAQIGSCYSCRLCKNENENYCGKPIWTYNGQYPDGIRTQGGYASAIRAHEQFVFPIPDALESQYAASMMCGGLTMYSPLKRFNAGPGKKVGIIGIGGLGHYGVIFAKAMGAEVYAFTHGTRKVDDIKKMGADHVVVTDSEGRFAKDLEKTIDLIICTIDNFDSMPLSAYLSTLGIHGQFVIVGIPDKPALNITAWDFNPNGCFVGGTRIGSKVEAIEMLQLAADKSIQPWIEVLPMSQAQTALERLKKSDVRYRFVLKQDLA